LEHILNKRIPALDSLYRRGDIRFFKQCPHLIGQVTQFLYKFHHATTPEEVYNLATEPGTPFRERITWFLFFQLNKSPLTLREISLWSALTASESQPYLDEEITKDMLFKLWSSRMANWLE
jgi:hypothetical protein